jgi:TrmH family RNA methyltransferase
MFVSTEDAVGAGLAERAGVSPVLVESHVLAKVSDTEAPQGPVAVMRIPSSRPVSRVTVVVGVADPGNAGTIVRTAAAFGLDIVPRDGAVDLWAPKVLRAGAGAHFRTTIGSHPPDRAIAAVVSGGISPRALSGTLDPDVLWSVLIGSEAHGLADDVVSLATVRVTIPMPGGTESLNAAVAAAVLMYEISTWRTSTSSNGDRPDR